MVRPPAVAGLIYAQDPDRLRAEVSELFRHAAVPADDAPKALIVPHAGYVYSGRVAASGFAALRASAETITRVVVIGPAHYVHERDALTALGDLASVVQADAPHAPEHALEVELPFLQVLLPPFTIVPLVVGEAEPQEVAEVLRRLWGGPETLIVVSSDLSHYHDYETARRIDAATAGAIERGDWKDIGSDRACGFLPVAGLLIEAGRRGLRAQRLSLCNSGDTAGSRDRVVGYGAWMFA
jgi:predicted class III extradiol MEMO1 family dioxygenase